VRTGRPKPGSVVRNSQHRSGLNHLTVQSGGRDWKIKNLNDSERTALGVTLRRSPAWITTMKFPTTSSVLPLIDYQGKFTGYGTYRVNWNPASYLGTVFATIFRRLKFVLAKRHGIGEFNKRQHLYMKCCAYYALTKNVYFWNRLLSITRKRDGYKVVSGLLHRLSSKLNDSKWFVYGSVCLQTYWLTSRALRPRDKSATINLSFPTRT